jgi:hypothetical protein
MLDRHLLAVEALRLGLVPTINRMRFVSMSPTPTYTHGKNQRVATLSPATLHQTLPNLFRAPSLVRPCLLPDVK